MRDRHILDILFVEKVLDEKRNNEEYKSHIHNERDCFQYKYTEYINKTQWINALMRINQ